MLAQLESCTLCTKLQLEQVHHRIHSLLKIHSKYGNYQIVFEKNIAELTQTLLQNIIRGTSFKRPLVPWRVFHVQKNMENFYPKGRRIIDPHLEGNLMHRGHREVALLDPDFRGRLSTPSGLLNDIPRNLFRPHLLGTYFEILVYVLRPIFQGTCGKSVAVVLLHLHAF